MVFNTVSPSEKNLDRIVEATKQLSQGRTNSVGKINLGLAGGVGSITNLNGGSGYPAGPFSNRPLTGGGGSGATANGVVNSTGNVVSVTIVQTGSGYVVGDVLGANFSGGSGFTFQVASLTTGTATLVIAPNCSVSSLVFLTPMTLNAANALTTTYVLQADIKKGQFTITHAIPVAGDCTFGWDCRG